jgi:hypothetical protein
MLERILIALTVVPFVAYASAAQEKKAEGKKARKQDVIMVDDVDDWRVEWFCGGPNASGGAQGPREECAVGGTLVFDSKGNGYVSSGTFIRMIPAEGPVRIIAGTPGVKGCTDGPAWKATFSGAKDLVMHDDILYVLDSTNLAVRKMEERDGRWHTETIAGVPGKKGHRDGPAREALFQLPFDGIAVDEDGVIYLLDGNWLRKLENGQVMTLNAGTGRNDGPLHQAGFNRAMGSSRALTYAGEGILYVGDRWNHAVRKVDLKKREVTTFAGVLPDEKKGPTKDGPAFEARFHPGGGPCTVAFNRKYGFLLVKAADEGNRIRWIKDGMVRTFGGFAGKKEKRPLVGPLRSIAGGGVCGMDREGNVYLGGAGGIRIARKKGAGQ